MYVYIKSRPGLFTTGHYDSQGNWVPESEHENEQLAGLKVRWLNGGNLTEDELTIVRATNSL